MGDWREEMQSALEAFAAVAKLAGCTITPGEMTVEWLPAPHRPPSRLPIGKMAVYAFWGDGCWLKIGKVGPQSNARYTSQHYSPSSAQSTLAGSLVGDKQMEKAEGFDPEKSGAWIKAHTSRVNVLLPADQPRELVSLLEAFLHLRLRPRYEG